MPSFTCPSCKSTSVRKQALVYEQNRRSGPRYTTESLITERVRPPRPMSVVLIPGFFCAFCFLAEAYLEWLGAKLDLPAESWRMSFIDAFDVVGLIGAGVFSLMAIIFNLSRLPQLRKTWEESAWICMSCGEEFSHKPRQ